MTTSMFFVLLVALQAVRRCALAPNTPRHRPQHANEEDSLREMSSFLTPEQFGDELLKEQFIITSQESAGSDPGRGVSSVLIEGQEEPELPDFPDLVFPSVMYDTTSDRLNADRKSYDEHLSVSKNEAGPQGVSENGKRQGRQSDSDVTKQPSSSVKHVRQSDLKVTKIASSSVKQGSEDDRANKERGQISEDKSAKTEAQETQSFARKRNRNRQPRPNQRPSGDTVSENTTTRALKTSAHMMSVSGEPSQNVSQRVSSSAGINGDAGTSQEHRHQDFPDNSNTLKWTLPPPQQSSVHRLQLRSRQKGAYIDRVRRNQQSPWETSRFQWMESPSLSHRPFPQPILTTERDNPKSENIALYKEDATRQGRLRELRPTSQKGDDSDGLTLGANENLQVGSGGPRTTGSGVLISNNEDDNDDDYVINPDGDNEETHTESNLHRFQSQHKDRQPEQKGQSTKGQGQEERQQRKHSVLMAEERDIHLTFPGNTTPESTRTDQQTSSHHDRQKPPQRKHAGVPSNNFTNRSGTQVKKSSPMPPPTPEIQFRRTVQKQSNQEPSQSVETLSRPSFIFRRPLRQEFRTSKQETRIDNSTAGTSREGSTAPLRFSVTGRGLRPPRDSRFGFKPPDRKFGQRQLGLDPLQQGSESPRQEAVPLQQSYDASQQGYVLRSQEESGQSQQHRGTLLPPQQGSGSLQQGLSLPQQGSRNLQQGFTLPGHGSDPRQGIDSPQVQGYNQRFQQGYSPPTHRFGAPQPYYGPPIPGLGHSRSQGLAPQDRDLSLPDRDFSSSRGQGFGPPDSRIEVPIPGPNQIRSDPVAQPTNVRGQHVNSLPHAGYQILYKLPNQRNSPILFGTAARRRVPMPLDYLNVPWLPGASANNGRSSEAAQRRQYPSQRRPVNGQRGEQKEDAIRPFGQDTAWSERQIAVPDATRISQGLLLRQPDVGADPERARAEVDVGQEGVHHRGRLAGQGINTDPRQQQQRPHGLDRKRERKEVFNIYGRRSEEVLSTEDPTVPQAIRTYSETEEGAKRDKNHVLPRPGPAGATDSQGRLTSQQYQSGETDSPDRIFTSGTGRQPEANRVFHRPIIPPLTADRTLDAESGTSANERQDYGRQPRIEDPIPGQSRVLNAPDTRREYGSRRHDHGPLDTTGGAVPQARPPYTPVREDKAGQILGTSQSQDPGRDRIAEDASPAAVRASPADRCPAASRGDDAPSVAGGFAGRDPSDTRHLDTQSVYQKNLRTIKIMLIEALDHLIADPSDGLGDALCDIIKTATSQRLSNGDAASRPRSDVTGRGDAWRGDGVEGWRPSRGESPTAARRPAAPPPDGKGLPVDGEDDGDDDSPDSRTVSGDGTAGTRKAGNGTGDRFLSSVATSSADGGRSDPAAGGSAGRRDLFPSRPSLSITRRQDGRLSERNGSSVRAEGDEDEAGVGETGDDAEEKQKVWDIWKSQKAGKTCELGPWTDWSGPVGFGVIERRRFLLATEDGDCKQKSANATIGDLVMRVDISAFNAIQTYYKPPVEVGRDFEADFTRRILPHEPRDLLLILDGSGSIVQEDFQLMRAGLDIIVRLFCGGFGHGELNNRLAIVTFASDVAVVHRFSDDQTPEALHDVIANMTQANGNTCTGDALKLARDSIFTTQNGARQNVTHDTLLVTDGHSNCGEITVQEGAQLLQNVSHVFALGIGLANDTEARWELGSVVSNSNPRHIFSLARFQDFKEMLESIESRQGTLSCLPVVEVGGSASGEDEDVDTQTFP